MGGHRLTARAVGRIRHGQYPLRHVVAGDVRRTGRFRHRDNRLIRNDGKQAFGGFDAAGGGAAFIEFGVKFEIAASELTGHIGVKTDLDFFVRQQFFQRIV